MNGRAVVDVPTPSGGWLHPWPNVAQLATASGAEDWTLVGGLMVALHAALRSIESPRATVDVDLVVHIETARGRVAHMHSVLTSLGYSLIEPTDVRKGEAHRFTRPGTPTGPNADVQADAVDIMVADHAAPSVVEKLGNLPMVAIEGGTQALLRTFNARLDIGGTAVEISVPDALGALILKSAAHQADSRDRERHLADSAVLLACMADPPAERLRMTSGSDRARVLHLHHELGAADHPAWLSLDPVVAREGQAALRLLSA
jgi:hypothetical protein